MASETPTNDANSTPHADEATEAVVKIIERATVEDSGAMADITRRMAAKTEGEAKGQDTIAHQPDAAGRLPLDSKQAQQGHPDSQEPVAVDARDMNSGGQTGA